MFSGSLSQLFRLECKVRKGAEENRQNICCYCPVQILRILDTLSAKKRRPLTEVSKTPAIINAQSPGKHKMLTKVFGRGGKITFSPKRQHCSSKEQNRIETRKTRSLRQEKGAEATQMVGSGYLPMGCGSCELVGAKTFGMSLETQRKQTCRWDIQTWDIPGVLESSRIKKLV